MAGITLSQSAALLSQAPPRPSADAVLALLYKNEIMDKHTASHRTFALLTLFDYHTDFFPKALEGLSEDAMHNRLNTAANHPAWLAGALIQQRVMMANGAGHDIRQTGDELFKDYKGIQEGARYPSNGTYLQDWEKVTPLAREALAAMNDEKLDSLFEMGDMKMTYYDLSSFTIYREANMIGQLALWRRLLGYPAIKYD